MGEWKKAPAWLVELFERGMPLDPRVERRTMFGFPSAFAQGQLFAGLFEETLLVRLEEQDRQELLAEEGAALFEPMAGRPMREYVVLPAAMLEDDGAVALWMKRGLAYALSLPPKRKGAKARRSPGGKDRKATAARPARRRV
jgi:TfoX/Sxy family transcriptional regulator of competence genes